MNPWRARRVIGWAHQGGAAEAAPNTVAAMRQALERGIAGLEFDVHLTADGRLVLNHDPVVAAGGTTYEIATTALDELRRAKPDVATMEEVLLEFPTVPLTVEIKAAAAAGPAIRTLAAGWRDRPVIVSSFSPAVVSAIRRQGLGLDTAPAWPAVLGLWACSRLRLPVPVARGHVAVQVSMRLDAVAVVKRIPVVRKLRLCDRRFVRAAHRRDLAVHVWTLDDRAAIEEALAADVDGIMTDRPSVLVGILRERGVAWAG